MSRNYRDTQRLARGAWENDEHRDGMGTLVALSAKDWMQQ